MIGVTVVVHGLLITGSFAVVRTLLRLATRSLGFLCAFTRGRHSVPQADFGESVRLYDILVRQRSPVMDLSYLLKEERYQEAATR